MTAIAHTDLFLKADDSFDAKLASFSSLNAIEFTHFEKVPIATWGKYLNRRALVKVWVRERGK